jgi:chaperonin GroES
MTGDVIPVSVKEGDKVLLPEFGGVKVNMGENTGPGAEAPEYYLFRDEELLGVLTE